MFVELLDDDEKLEFDFEKHLHDELVVRDENGEVIPNARLPGGGLSSADKTDFRRGTVVCRHWLRGLCMKGETCEFLHQYDMTKMPECRWGMGCQVSECPFRHVPDEERLECTFYKHGFCIHGPICRYRHIKLPAEECPETADFSLAIDGTDEEGNKKRKTPTQNEFYKIAMCKHWEKTGECPFGSECHFAHGKEELRSFPTKNAVQPRAAEAAAPVVSKEPLPDADVPSRYFVIHSASYQNLADAVHHNQWSVQPNVAGALEQARASGKKVFVFFTVPHSKHLQGCASVTARIPIDGVNLDQQTLPYEWKGHFSIQFHRLCELPYTLLEGQATAAATNAGNGQELEIGTGKALMETVYEQPIVQLHHKSVEDENSLPNGAFELASRRRHASELAAGRESVPKSDWNMPSPGFMVACNNITFDECFGRLMFGMAAEHETSASCIQPGTPLFLLNMSDRHVLGVFQAMTGAIMNQDPTAFARGPNIPSPFPLQIRFSIMYNAPAIPENDPAIQSLVGARGSLRIGAMSLELTQRLADVFAFKTGRPPQQGGGGRSENVETMLVGIEEDRDFQVSRRIIGPGGSNLKRIIEKVGGGNVKLQLRGRGSGHREGGVEPTAPLALLVTASDPENLRRACEQAHELLGSVHRDYDHFRRRGGRGGRR